MNFMPKSCQFLAYLRGYYPTATISRVTGNAYFHAFNLFLSSCDRALPNGPCRTVPQIPLTRGRINLRKMSCQFVDSSQPGHTPRDRYPPVPREIADFNQHSYLPWWHEIFH